MVKKVNERTSTLHKYDKDSDKINNKSQKFAEYIYPDAVGEGVTLDNLCDSVAYLMEKYGKFWKEIKVTEIKTNSDDTIKITLDCYR